MSAGIPGADPPGTIVASASSTSTADTTVIPTIPPNCQFWADQMIIDNSNAATKTGVILKNVAANGGGTTLGPFPAPFGGGATFTFKRPVPFIAGQPAVFACQAGVTTISVTLIGYFAPKTQ